MRLLSTKSREYKGKEYRKYFVILPVKLVEKLGWKTGDELTAAVKKEKMVVGKR